jgi:hypothetical protein
MERRDMEENEPLSRRRARIRGEQFQPRGQDPTTQNEAPSLRTLENSAVEEDLIDEHEGETLAQRVKRLKAQRAPIPDVSKDFAMEVSSQLGLKIESALAPSKTPDAEETLGQRRKRLQQEALSKKGDASSGAVHGFANHSKPDNTLPNSRQDDRMLASKTTGQLFATQDENVPLSQLRNTIAMQAMVLQQSPYTNAVPYANNAFTYGNPMIYSPTTVGSQYGASIMPGYIQDPMMGPPIDPKQRIDRWRQGVV